MQTTLKSLVHSVTSTLVEAAHWIDQATREPRHQARRRAQSMVEYAIIAALVAVVAIGAIKLLGTSVTTAFTNITTGVNDNTTGAAVPKP